MATGPQHYQKAEQHLEQARAAEAGDSYHLLRAQVHATLAQAAALALSASPDVPGGMPYDDFNTWYEVAGEHTGNE